jgi:signal transduction histidine kinase
MQLQATLRHSTREVLSAQEKERQSLSHQLQDEIAQSLLGIHVRLLHLRTATKTDLTKLAKEIIRTQQMVEESIREIQRFTRELEVKGLAQIDRTSAGS